MSTKTHTQGASMTTRTRAKAIPPTMDLASDLSPAVKALEVAYRAIRRRVPEAPEVTIVVKRDARAWGHTTVDRVWTGKGSDKGTRYEIMVSGENLRRGAIEVMATLLHEAAHAINLAEGVRDCDVNGRHNKAFKSRAESLGLDVAEAGWHGWTATSLPAEGVERWKRAIDSLALGLDRSAAAVPHPAPAPAPTVKPVKGGGKGPTPLVPPTRTGRRNLIKAECGCGYSIRLSGKVLDGARPTCQVCGQAFAAVA